MKKLTTLINEDDCSGGGFSDGGNGMGNVISSQPSYIPGDVAGSTPGSGDVTTNLGPYLMGYNQFKKKRRKKKKK